MDAIRLEQVLTEDGKVVITGLPCKKGQAVEITLRFRQEKLCSRPRLTVRDLRRSGLIGLWKDRDDIVDSAAYARWLRKQAEKRGNDGR